MQNKNWQVRFFSSPGLTGREERVVFAVAAMNNNPMKILQVGGEGIFHTGEKIGNIFEEKSASVKETIKLIQALRGNLVGINKVDVALNKVREATERSFGLKELVKKAANEEIDCHKFTELVNYLLKKEVVRLGDIPDRIDHSNNHIAIYKFPEIGMIGAK